MWNPGMRLTVGPWRGLMCHMKQTLRTRCSADLVKRLDSAAKRLSPPGVNLSRSDVVRMAIETGLPVLLKGAARGGRGR